MRTAPWARWAGLACAAGIPLLAVRPAAAQVRIDDLVFTAGGSVESYEGNLSAVTVPVIDSTDRASAAVGEFAAHGELRLLESSGTFWDHYLSVDFDAGFRQFAAAGFELRDYAPREWVGRLDLSWWQRLGNAGMLTAAGTFRGRSVEDRTPMPLFLQPGYTTARGELVFQTYDIEGVSLDVALDAESTNYESLPLLSQLDLLDRRSRGIELGAVAGRESWRVRFYGGFRKTDYRRQDSFVPEDPYRRDRTLHMGADWALTASAVEAELGVEGTLNRSNSQRPEYDAVSASAAFHSPLPFWDLGIHLYGVLTGKTYVHDSPFVRLVPGEEADNASVAYIALDRPIAENLGAVVRFGWARAETDIGNSYYSRFGTSFLLNYRP
jgi:hypothetical protein